MPCWRVPLGRNDGDPLNDHQCENHQRKDNPVAKEPPGKEQVTAVAADHIHQQAGADGDHQNDCKQTQQPHAGLGVLVQPAGHACGRPLGLFEGDQIPGFAPIEQFAGEHIV